ncbi:hypothetical protein [Crocosphaera sp.]|uniref:hypothetical protein n=1 Tax=Crocosphaera sp. TaxID=2729996 RepID=UPI002625FEE4|nr:hypothetical protein [Crocosphaera sp.]MDJ0580746.1 hypothetical protein [Crocosphaera sp.]
MGEEVGSEIACQLTSGNIYTVQGFSKCLEYGWFSILWFSILAFVITLVMLFIIYAKDIKLFKRARQRIAITIIIFTFIDVTAEIFIYLVSRFIIYPAYQSIVEIPHVKILIFVITSYIIVDIIISNRNQEYITTELDNTFSGFGVGTGIFWINSKLLSFIEFFKNVHSVMTNFLLDAILEDKYREPLRKRLIKSIENTPIATIIQTLENRLTRNANNSLLLQRFNNTMEQYKQNNDEQKLKERLVELSTEAYSTEVIEEWKNGNIPFS